MENLQATTVTLPKTASTTAAPTGPAEADPTSGETLTGFQTLLARHLKGLLAAPGDAGTLAGDAAATDETTRDTGDSALTAAATAAEMPWLALLQLVPAAPPASPAIGQASDSAEITGLVGAAPGGPLGARAETLAALDQAPEVAGAAADFADEMLSLAADRMPGRERTGDTRDPGAATAPQPGFLHNLTAPTPAAASATQAAAQTQLSTPLGQPAWGSELGQKLVWMVAGKQHIAEMHINPPQLGPIDIKLTVEGKETTAIFISPHAEVRQALESALPRLREVLAESGLMLGNASVTADNPGDGSAFAQPQQRAPRLTGGADSGAEGEATRAAVVSVRARGMVDLFA